MLVLIASTAHSFNVPLGVMVQQTDCRQANALARVKLGRIVPQAVSGKIKKTAQIRPFFVRLGACDLFLFTQGTILLETKDINCREI
jgi:hypothetical protein